ncbi:MAG TPA: disulfide bond formation protein B [Steroidobacteraceae bacterium]
MLKNPRFINFAGFIACAAMIAYALYTQYVDLLDACPLCIFQRVGIISLGAVFLFAGLHSPRGWGRFVYAALVAVAALVTIGISVRHVYIQHLPPGEIPSCGAPLGVLIKFTPMFELIRKVLTGSGECAQVNWRFLGLAMPTWVAICTAALGTVGVVTNAKRR